MALKKLTKSDLQGPVASRIGYEPYKEVMADMRVGEGGRVMVEEEDVQRVSVKNRVKKSAEAMGLKIKFIPTGQDTVVFEVVGRSN